MGNGQCLTFSQLPITLFNRSSSLSSLKDLLCCQGKLVECW